MAVLQWDLTGEHKFETGVDHGVLYIPDGGGAYTDGVAWNGLTAVTETPSGAEASAQYADNIKYLNLYSAEEFGLTLEAFTYPDEFAQFDGAVEAAPGVVIGQQARTTFGLCYRTKIGNDIEGNDAGYKLHLVYGCTASPSERAYSTINDSPEAVPFSWEIQTLPVSAGGNYKPTSLLTVDSTKVSSGDLTDLEEMLYGTSGTDPSLPTPAAVIALFAGTQTVTAFVTAPTYNSGTKVITIPTITGVTYYKDGVALTAGAQPAITADTIITARPDVGYVFPDITDADWSFDF